VSSAEDVKIAMKKIAITSDVETIATTTLNDQWQGDTVALADGRIFAAWRSAGIYLNESIIRGRFLSADGTQSGPDFLVNSANLPGASNYNVDVEVLGSGRIFVSWTSKQGDNSGTSINGRFFSSTGVPIGGEFVVNTTKLNNQLNNQTIKMENGGVLVIFATFEASSVRGGNYMMRGCYFDTNGNRIGPDFAFDNAVDDLEIQTAVGTADGGLLLVYRHAPAGSGSYPGTFYAQKYDSSGAAVGSELAIGTRDTGASINIDAVQLANGNVFFSWTSWETAAPSPQIIRGRMMDASGNFLSDDFDIGPSVTGGDIDVAQISNGQLIMTYTKRWTTLESSGYVYHSAVYGQQLSATGAHIGGPIQISDPTKRDCRDAHISVGSDGRIYVSWTTEDGLGDFSGTSVQGRYLELINALAGTSNNDAIRVGDGPDSISGLAGNDLIATGSGNDTLVGGTGVDTMFGGVGNDHYFVDSQFDKVIEITGGGADTVFTSVDYFLSQFVEILVQAGANGQKGVGNNLNNKLFGNSGNSTLNGGAGNDSIWGASGNDAIIAGAGNDFVSGDAGNDSIFGSEGNDILLGGDFGIFSKESDALYGGSGDDTLNGGNGDDRLSGDLGADRFVFDVTFEQAYLGARKSIDVITDFKVDQGDIIDLSSIDARTESTVNDSFDFIGSIPFYHRSGQLRFSGGNLEGDINGDGISDFTIKLVGVLSISETSLIL
jgi:Ca2+-binding RTX toxin-like protein